MVVAYFAALCRGPGSGKINVIILILKRSENLLVAGGQVCNRSLSLVAWDFFF